MVNYTIYTLHRPLWVWQGDSSASWKNRCLAISHFICIYLATKRCGTYCSTIEAKLHSKHSDANKSTTVIYCKSNVKLQYPSLSLICIPPPHCYLQQPYIVATLSRLLKCLSRITRINLSNKNMYRGLACIIYLFLADQHCACTIFCAKPDRRLTTWFCLLFHSSHGLGYPGSARWQHF